MFDLVLNHISRDSPLVAGTFKHFLDKKIDTAEWFVPSTDSKWNDVVPFDYDKKGNIEEIFEHLWKPFIEKMIKRYGFSGVRIDFATGPKVCNKIIKMCVDYIKVLQADAVVFAEDLYPGSKEDRIINVLNKSKDVGFTHVTNIAMYLPESSVGDKSKYEPVLVNLGLKKPMTYASLTTVQFRPGTIGFPGSHDEGTALQAGFSVDFKDKTKALGIAKNLNNLSTEEKLILAKKRMAIAAFSSDAGWYLLAGDEILSTLSKSPFVRQDGTSFAKGTDKLEDGNEIKAFIKSINTVFMSLRSANDVFWFEIFFSPCKHFMYFIRHLGSGDATSTDIVTVSLGENGPT